MICVWCSDRPFPEAAVTEAADEPMRARLSGVVSDPRSLRFCNADCQQRFHTNLRRLIVEEHPDVCMCVVCMSRA